MDRIANEKGYVWTEVFLIKYFFKEYMYMDFAVPKHNTPAATLIKNYKNKRSGKVSVSRREIQQRFNGMEWRHQKQILLAFINAGATDREWACKKMFAFWDNSFIPVVKELWEQYQEFSLSWLILRYFPKEYIKQNMDRLSQGRNYYYLCQRLIDEDGFEVDKNRLYESDMIQLFKITKKKVTDEEISEVFFSMIRKICNGEYRSSYMYDWDKDYCVYNDWSILCNRKVRDILYDIDFLLCRKSLADAINMWSNRIVTEVKESNEYRMLRQMEKHGQNIQTEFIALIKKYCLKHLDLYDVDKEYKSTTILDSKINAQTEDSNTQQNVLKKMQMDNPSVNRLVDSLSLELMEQLPF